MSLHLRKMMVRNIEDSKSPNHLLMSADWYEEQILDLMTGDNAENALGALTVVCADLLELVRRSDPAYGLTPVEKLPPAFQGKPHAYAQEADSDE